MMAAVLDWNYPEWSADLFLRLGLDEIETKCAKSIKRGLQDGVTKRGTLIHSQGANHTISNGKRPVKSHSRAGLLRTREARIITSKVIPD